MEMPIEQQVLYFIWHKCNCKPCSVAMAPKAMPGIQWSATVVGHFLRVFECTRLESWPNELFNVQLIPTLVASSTVHIYIANLEPQSKME